MSTDAFLYFLLIYCCVHHLAATLELLRWLLNDDGFSSTDKPPSILFTMLFKTETNSNLSLSYQVRKLSNLICDYGKFPNLPQQCKSEFVWVLKIIYYTKSYTAQVVYILGALRKSYGAPWRSIPRR
jgi:hypothetical protein